MNMEEAEMLADEILTAAGTSLKHYMPMSKTKIIEAAKSWQEMVDSVNDTNRVLLNKIKVLDEKCDQCAQNRRHNVSNSPHQLMMEDAQNHPKYYRP